jgi:hypothetical protein
MATKRQQIVSEIVTNLKTIDGTTPWLSNLWNNVFDKLIFWDEVNDFPTVSVVSGDESREYLPGNFKWAYLTVNIRIYVKADDPKTELENIFGDIESVIDDTNELGGLCVDTRILSLTDDEGLLAPLGVGEIILQVQYSII